MDNWSDIWLLSSYCEPSCHVALFFNVFQVFKYILTFDYVGRRVDGETGCNKSEA